MAAAAADVQNDQGDLGEPAEHAERVQSLVRAADHHAVVAGPVGAAARVAQRAVHVPGEQGEADGPDQQDEDVGEQVHQRVQEGAGVDQLGDEEGEDGEEGS